MERISKSHEKYKLMKDMIKTNHYPNITVTDDLEVLSLAINANLKIKILLYSYQINKYLQKLIGAFHISIMQDVQILFKCLLLFLILPFY